MYNLNNSEKHQVVSRRPGFSFLVKMIQNLSDEMIMEESKWTKKYFMLGFNFLPNHKCGMWMRRDNISKTKSEVNISLIHWFFRYQNKKTKQRTKLDQFRLVPFGFKPNQTRLDTFLVCFGLNFGFVQTANTPTCECVICLELLDHRPVLTHMSYQR